MTSLIRHAIVVPVVETGATQSSAPGVAQCCAKISRLVAGCHD